MTVADVLSKVEAAGIAFRLDGEKVRVWYPDDERRDNLAEQVAFLRARRSEVAEFLRTRHAILALAPGVRLIRWNLKEPPVAIETCAVVTDPANFARTTLEQLRVVLTEPTRWVGWTVPQLIDRLATVGVVVSLETKRCGTEAGALK